MKMKTRQNKLGTYLAVTAGVGCASSVSDAAVTFYGINSANDTNPDPAGIALGLAFGGRAVDTSGGALSYFAFAAGFGPWTRGADITATFDTVQGAYTSYGVFDGNAQSGPLNYTNISFDGNDDVYEAVGQFFFDGTGGGYLIAIATNDAPNSANALTISAGKTMIDAAAVPEPSGLALLALGATGLFARRRRKAAA